MHKLINMKKALSFVIFLLGCIGIYAESVEVNGIYYELNTTDYTATVIYNNSGTSYSGNVVIPESIIHNGSTFNVTSINSEAFFGCTGLTSVILPNSVTRIGNKAFQGCTSLTSVTISNSVTSIGNSICSGCTNLIDVYINIVDFANNNICYNIASNCHYIYEGNEIKGDFTIPNSVKALGSRALYGCTGLTSITIPNSVTSIGNYAFNSCTGITSVTIPNSVTSIGDMAFRGCTSLTSITIPNSVTNIGSDAFYVCTDLTSVKYTTTRPFGIAENCFSQEVYDNATLIVAKGYLPTVGSLDGWRKFKNIVEAGAAPKQDVNGDGKVNTADVVAIYEYIINGDGVTSPGE